MLESVECMLCGAIEQSPYFSQGKWHLVRCNNCGLVFLNPRPDSEEISRLYDKSYYIDRQFQDDHTEAIVQSEIQVRVQPAKKIAQEISIDCNWLDIGCGSGYLLAAARSLGCDVQGIEISKWAADFAADTLELPIFNGGLADFSQQHSGAPYSVITMMAYLEHSHTPLKDLSMVSRILSDQGVVVVRVPDVSSFDRFWHGSKWRGWHLPFHLYHFSPRTLLKTMQMAGLQAYRTESIFWNPILHLKNAIRYRDLRWDGPLEGRPKHMVAKSDPDEPVRVSEPPAWKKLVINALSQILTGRDVIVYARKAD